MATLETTFAGLKLKNPIIVSSSGLTDSAAKNQKLSEAGAGAIVLKSLFEEQIMMEADWMGDPNMYPEGSDYLVGYIREHKLGEYLNLIKESKKVCNIPIIASINCYQNADWVEFAAKIEEAGADALMRGMTQKYLGMALGFPEKSADVRLAQYENGSRTPKADVTAALAQVLDVSPKALDVPDIDSYIGLMHTLFTLEDRYGLEVCECEDEVHLRVHIHKGRDAAELHRMLTAWGAVAAKLKAGKITKEEYDRWRYRYPELDTSGQWHKITPSQELSDLLLADLKEHSEE